MEEDYSTLQRLCYSLLLPCFAFLVLSTKFLLQKRNQGKISNLPPSPFALPIIGHLHLLKQPIQRTLHSLSEKHGPIFSVKLGSRLAVVISSPSAVEECFTKNDIVLANRPHFLVSKYLNYNNTTMGTVEYGDHWRNLRRISALEILSPARLTSLFSNPHNLMPIFYACCGCLKIGGNLSRLLGILVARNIATADVWNHTLSLLEEKLMNLKL